MMPQVYLDDGMTGYRIYNNTFIDCQNGLLFNGGRDNYVYNNYFQDVDYVAYIGDECKNIETYNNLKAVGKWPAWSKYKSQKPAMTIPPTFSEFSNLSCVAGGNQFKGNSYCRVKDAFFKGSPQAKSASVYIGNVEKCQSFADSTFGVKSIPRPLGFGVPFKSDDGLTLPSTLPISNFSTVPIASWCGNRSGPLATQSVQAFATQPFIVFEKDMAQNWAGAGLAANRSEELKIAMAAAAVRAATGASRGNAEMERNQMELRNMLGDY